MPRILHVLTSPRAEGTPRLVLDWLTVAGVDQGVFFLSVSPGDLLPQFERAAAWLRVGPGLPRGPAKFGTIVQASGAAARAFRPDLVIAWPMGFSHWIFLGVRAARIPARLLTHGGNPPSPGWRHRYLMTWISLGLGGACGGRVVACSRYVQRQFQQIAGVPQGQIAFAYNSVRADAVAAGAARGRAQRAPGEPFRAIMVATLERHKDHATLLAAARVLAASGTRCEILLAGAGALEGELRAESARVGADSIVRFLGARADVPELLGRSDLFVLATTAQEGRPGVILEALAAGLPIVASDVPPVREVLEDGRWGRLVPAGDPFALAAALREAIASGPTLPDAAEERRRHARTFTPERMVRDYLALAGLQLDPAAPPPAAEAPGSYGEIVRSSVLIGGSSGISMGLSILRSKVLAVFIGTAGMGMFGAYASVASLVQGVAAMGITASGSRQISEAAGTGDEEQVARMTLVLRRTSLLLGLLGATALAALSRPISVVTFGTPRYAGPLAWLSLTVLLSEISGGQGALLQGLRRVRELAAVTVASAVLGTVVAVPLIWWLRERGVVPFLIAVAAISLGCSWWQVRRIPLRAVAAPWSIVWKESRQLVGLGLVFMTSALMTSAVAYLTRVMILRRLTLDAAGLFQSSWALCSTCVGFILAAMGADYFPRLTAACSDPARMNRLADEQTEAAVLMGAPLILGGITLAPAAIALLYSARFVPAAPLLRWQLLGVLLRLMAWPLSLVLPAMNRARLLFWTELGTNTLHLGLCYAGLTLVGLNGLGIAYAALYAVYLGTVVLLTRRLTGFVWSGSTRRLLVGTGLAAAVACAAAFLTERIGPWGFAPGVALTGAAAWYSIRRLARRTGTRPAVRLRMALQRFGLRPA